MIIARHRGRILRCARRHRGASLLEMVGWMAFAGIGSIIVAALIEADLTTGAAQSLSETVLVVADHAGTRCALDGDCTRLTTTEAAVDLSVIPARWLDGRAARLPTGHEVVVLSWAAAQARLGVNPTPAGFAPTDGFVAGIAGLSADECVALTFAIEGRFPNIWAGNGRRLRTDGQTLPPADVRDVCEQGGGAAAQGVYGASL